MRKRQPARPNSNADNASQVPAEPARAAVPFERVFTPSDLDLDDLAEAVRGLLDDGGALHLLSLPPRGTHVVEATRAH